MAVIKTNVTVINKLNRKFNYAINYVQIHTEDGRRICRNMNVKLKTSC